MLQTSCSWIVDLYFNLPLPPLPSTIFSTLNMPGAHLDYKSIDQSQWRSWLLVCQGHSHSRVFQPPQVNLEKVIYYDLFTDCVIIKCFLKLMISLLLDYKLLVLISIIVIMFMLVFNLC